MNYFCVTLQIVFGILFPFMLLAVLVITAMWYKIRWDEQDERDFKKWFLSREWNFVEFLECGNPDYVGMRFRNGKTNDFLNINVEKSILSPSPGIQN